MDEENGSQEGDWYKKFAACVASESGVSAVRRAGKRPSSLSMSWGNHEGQEASPALSRWWKAVRQICKHDDDIDPWHTFPINNVASESAIRYRYSAIKKRWVQDDVRVKLENLPFDHGAMRECFRLKKLSNNSTKSGDTASTSNYVAKKYIKVASKDVYFEDVKLQMESKLWSEEYNRQNPPKKIDIFQLSVIELVERENRPLYHIEHFMEGNYRKYNSNSGYVDDVRNTPQAFSHFTFERSGHRIIIVDIQGVGDLYTDPQIHTADGLNYGDGNLGLRGMALFFSSHRCNQICAFLGLSEFDMAASELGERDLSILNNDDSDSNTTDNQPEEDLSVFSDKLVTEIKKRNRSISFKMSGTVIRDDRQSPMIASPIFLDKLFPAPVDLMRALSLDSGVLSASNPFVSHNNLIASSMADSEESLNSIISGGNSQCLSQSANYQQTNNDSRNVSYAIVNSSRKLRRRQRNYSDGSDIDAALMTHEDYLAIYHSMRDNQKPASASHPTNLDQEIGHSILAQVHHELARLHESGRLARYKQKEGSLLHQHFWSHVLSSDGNYDSQIQDSVTDRGIEVNWDACLFHERQAAQLGCLEAVITIARYSLNMSGHMLHDCSIPPSGNDTECGLDYLWRAADSGDRRSMIELANMYRTSPNIEPNNNEEKSNSNVICRNHINIDWAEAVKWYKRAFEAVSKTDGQTDAKDVEGRYDSADDLLPPQELLAAMAELYSKGGYGLEANYQLAGELYSNAAEFATNALKGRQAVKYYELSDEAFAKVHGD